MSIHGRATTMMDQLVGRAAGPPPVSPAQAPWVNALTQDLRRVCSALAGTPDAAPAVEELDRLLAETRITLLSRRCLTCAYAEVSPRAIDDYVASRIIRQRVPAALVEDLGDALIGRVFEAGFTDAEQELALVREALARRDIAVQERDSGMQVCPICQSDNTTDYGWVMDEDGQFTAGHDSAGPDRLAG